MPDYRPPAGSGGSGAVTSVATRTGDVVLTAADVGAGTFPGNVAFNGTVTLPSGLVLPASVDIGTALSAVGDGTPAINGTAARGTGTHAARNDHVHPTDTTRLAASTTLDAVTAPAANVSLNSHKITNLTNGSSAQDAAAFGQIPVSGGVGGFGKIVVRTADSSTISTQATPQSDDTLLWAVGTTDRWFFQAFLTFTQANGAGSSTTADLKIGFSVPANGTMQWGGLGVNTNATGMAGYGYSTTTSSPNAILTQSGTLSLGGNAGTYGVALSGYYTGVDTAGNVTLQWSQNTSDASTLLIGKNSMLILWRIS